MERSGGALVCQGKIDQLYSWGPQVKIDYLKNQSWTGQLMRDGKEAPVFTSQSGYSTFGYGARSIRFRLKPGVRFQFFDNTPAYSVCQQVVDVDNTVAVRYWDIGQLTGTDYILCSLGPVHSWSISTSIHFAELQREKSWIERYQGMNNGYFNYEMYVKVSGVDNMPDKLDGFDFTPAIWRSRKATHQQYLPGEVFFNPSLAAADKQTAQHFKTEWPTYINPGEGGGVQPQPDLIGDGGGGGGADGSLKFSDFIPSKFKSASGRTLWLNAGKACSAKKGGSPVQCTWTFTAPNQIEAKFSDATWYYKAKDASNICFTGEGSPGANCAAGGEMTKYN